MAGTCSPGVPHLSLPLKEITRPQPHPPETIALLPAGAELRVSWFTSPHGILSRVLPVRYRFFIEMETESQ